jgi:hypothetical protein
MDVNTKKPKFAAKNKKSKDSKKRLFAYGREGLG